jgi:hypothetical protein
MEAANQRLTLRRKLLGAHINQHNSGRKAQAEFLDGLRRRLPKLVRFCTEFPVYG